MAEIVDRMNEVVLRSSDGRSRGLTFADATARGWWTKHHRAAFLAALDPADAEALRVMADAFKPQLFIDLGVDADCVDRMTLAGAALDALRALVSGNATTDARPEAER